jgi:hypothetical protein
VGLMNEYINRRLGAQDLEKELLRLITDYNKLRNSFALVFVTALQKSNIPDIVLSQDDYYLIHDLLRDTISKKLDIYLETPGGSGEAAEEIVRCLRSKFEEVSFVISGEAKSAGTILALSGDEIFMTETGSLGPIDAQVKIGRSQISAFDYLEWTEQKRQEAANTGKLNPFDATIVAQISPGEFSGVLNSLKFAEDLVTAWLPKYKFKNWTVTESRKIPVTQEMRETRAREVAAELTNHGKWRSHGRSLKAKELNDIGLKVKRVEDDDTLCNIVYRIQTVCRLIFASSNTYKIFATANEKIVKSATVTNVPSVPVGPIIPVSATDVVEVETKCPKCGKDYRLYAKFGGNPQIDKDFQSKGAMKFPKDDKIRCTCGFEIDLKGVRNDLELKVGKKIKE